jgi:hypothetical protein
MLAGLTAVAVLVALAGLPMFSCTTDKTYTIFHKYAPEGYLLLTPTVLNSTTEVRKGMGHPYCASLCTIEDGCGAYKLTNYTCELLGDSSVAYVKDPANTGSITPLGIECVIFS